MTSVVKQLSGYNEMLMEQVKTLKQELEESKRTVAELEVAVDHNDEGAVALQGLSEDEDMEEGGEEVQDFAFEEESRISDAITDSDVQQMLVARASFQKERQGAATVLLDRSASQKEPADTLKKLEDSKTDLKTKKMCIDKLFALGADPKTQDDVAEKANRASKAVVSAFDSAQGDSALEVELRYNAMRFLAYVGLRARTEYGTAASAFRRDKSERVRAQAANAIYSMDKVVASLDDFKETMEGAGDQSILVLETVDKVLHNFGKRRATLKTLSSLQDVYTVRCHSRTVSAYPCDSKLLL